MTLLRLGSAHPDLASPLPTAAKRVRAWVDSPSPEPNVVPALDVARLQARYGPDTAYAPRMREATFMVPLHATADQLEARCKDAARRFIEAMAKKGLDLCTDRTIQFYAGIYPSRDLRDNTDVLDHRDYICRAWFRARAPKATRLELKPEWLRPIVPAVGAPRIPRAPAR